MRLLQISWLVFALISVMLAGCLDNSAEARPGRASRRADQGPKAGTAAPDFTLAYLDSDETATLSDYAGETPVVLIFGSYT